MVRRGSFIGGQDNLSVPDAPTIGAATAGNAEVSVAFTAPSDVGDDPITLYGASATDGTNVIGATNSASPVTITGLTNGTSYTARVWAINDYGNGPLSDATSSFTPAIPSLGLMAGGDSGSGDVDLIEQIDIATTANVTDFGDLLAAKEQATGAGSDTRGVIAGGYTSQNVIQYITYASAGNATDFGDLSASRYNSSSASNNVRMIVAAGYEGSEVNTMEYINIQTTGNAIDFGDLGNSYYNGNRGQINSTTRALFAHGLNGSTQYNNVEYVTIVTSASSTDFGDSSGTCISMGSASSTTRGLIGGGRYSSSDVNTIEYFTIASTGNATDFGDLTVARRELGGVSSATRAVFVGGVDKNEMDYVTIASTGNATDFGDLSGNRAYPACMSSLHGGVLNEDYFAPAAMGMFAGGVQPAGGLGTYGTTIEYIDIASTGNTAMFGDLSVARSYVGSTASSTRAVHAGGYTGVHQDVIDFVLFSTKGIATDFGNLLSGISSPSGSGSNTRGIFAGSTPRSNVIQYITIASAGNATDFGDMTVSVQDRMSASSTTRSVMAGGYEASDDVNVIDYITIASTGNATDFGDLSVGTTQTNGAVSSNTRAVFGLGRPYDASSGTSSTVNTLEYVTIASTGNSTDFGDLTVARYYGSGASSKVRGVFAGGSTYPSGGSPYLTTTMDYITIASTGNAQDFGDIISESYAYGGSSNSHGGIS